MNFYDDLVMQTQMNYSRHYPIYASGSTPYQPVSYTHLDVYKRQADYISIDILAMDAEIPL